MKTLILTLVLAIPVSAQEFLKTKNITEVVVLPVVGESVPSSVRDAAAEHFIKAIKTQRPEIRTVNPDESATKLTDAGRLDDLASFLNLFVKTGTINQPALARCGEALNGHLLLIEVQEYTERGGSWLRGRSGQNTARIQYTLFTKSGQQIWQTLESLHRSQLTTTVAPMPEIVARVSERAVGALIKGEERKDVKQKRGGRVIY